MITRNKATTTIEYGDYQTPLPFARSVCAKLKDVYSLSPAVVFEPTFGTGNFIESALAEFDDVQSVFGVELNKKYFAAAQQRILPQSFPRNITLYNEDIFSFDFSDIKGCITRNESILIIGNPPWVTNSQLSAINSYNLPLKENFKGHSGLDAITGKGNFDIAEYIILQLLSEFSGYNCTLAMLCKTIVAKNIIRDIENYHFEISAADMFVFNANDVFNVSCDAGLFVVTLGHNRSTVCDVFDYYTNKKERQFGWVEGAFLSNTATNDTVANIDGICQFEWRQGIKHDCSKVMELKCNEDGTFINGFGETLSLPIGQYIFPLIKSSDIKGYIITETKKYVIVTQNKVNADTFSIEQKEKSVWDYLLRYANMLNARRSTIYKKAPPFAVFGVGDYSFSKYKIGISGFYKEPKFSLIMSDLPIMLDDTCYFIGFDNAEDALITVALLNSYECAQFLKSIAFLDSKRPYTKEVLKRIDILKLLRLNSFDYVCNYIKTLNSGYYVSQIQYADYANRLSGGLHLAMSFEYDSALASHSKYAFS
ncbi:MAG: hypothetical protein LBK23_06630 [Oscillospiraceae bacterium]|jgi:16S rRNA A1518/A1519 N6-dimethyltransferase RsmA/KsgA/DIM1 with predicted DNA glycosylase/AP lyase activity|nr:hypothetical protein [Oscillospiraceae bacterium]